MKGIRTTIAAFIGLVIVLGLVTAYVFGKIDVEGLTVSLGAVGTSISIIVGFLSKDANKSHTQG